MTSSQQSPAGIAFDRSGPVHRSPIVLVHAGVADRRMWEPTWQGLTAGRDCVRLDLRGFGDSTGLPAGSVHHAADVIDVLDHLGIEGCHLVGASLGAGVVTEVALTRPRLARSLLLCPPGGSLLAELTPDLRHFIDAETAALSRDDLDGAVEANIAAWVLGRGRSESEVDPAVLAAVREMQRRAFEVTASWGDVDEIEMDPPALDRLAELAIPVLVLVGGHDLRTTHHSADTIRAAAPRAEQVVWEDAAHLPSMEKPARFLDLVLGWVSSHD